MAATQRTYQDESGPYQLPNDAPEHDRLDGQSVSIIALMNGRPFHARVTEPKRILDIGCGTGHMTNLLASTYPSAEVIGVDIAAVPLSRHQKASNVHFVQGDIRDLMKSDPRFESGSFDYVFQRLLVVGVTRWPEYTASIATLLRPGGWLEMQDASTQVYSANSDRISDTWSFYRPWISDANAMGLDPEIGPKLFSMLKTIPILKDIEEREYRFSPGPRPDRPELAGVDGQLAPLWGTLLKKVCGPRRSAEELERFEKELDQVTQGSFNEGDHFKLLVVTGMRKAG